MTEKQGPFFGTQSEAVEALVTHPTDGAARAFGRLCATGIPDLVDRYLKAEAARGAAPADAVVALTQLAASLVGSVVILVVPTERQERVVGTIAAAFQRALEGFVEEAAAERRAMGQE